MEYYNTSFNATKSSTNDINGKACIAAYAVIATLGLSLNIVALVIIICGKKFGKSVKMQLLNLSIVDLIGAALVTTLDVTTGCKPQTYFGNTAMCKVHLFTLFTVLYLSVLLNMVIAIERFVAVYFPLKMLTYRKRDRIAVISATWIAASIVNLDIAIYSQVQPSTYHSNITICDVQNTLIDSSSDLLQLTVRLKLLLPTFTILLMYILIFVKLKCHQRLGGNESNSRRSTDQKVFYLVVFYNNIINCVTVAETVYYLNITLLQFIQVSILSCLLR